MFFKARLMAMSIALLGIGTACIPTGTTTSRTSTTSTATPTPTYSPAAGTKAARIIFKQSSTSGSFDVPTSGGTKPGIGLGHQAVRVFNPDGSLLASGGPTGSAWPKWLSSVEIGLSGATNTSATNSNCAKFAGAGEDVSGVCRYAYRSDSSTTTTTPCGAPGGVFRVSEVDCTSGTMRTGDGGPDDGVYIRAVFNRSTDYLSTGENILAVLEYAASTLNSAPSVPTSCFNGGVFSPEICSDQTWKIYLKRSTTEIVQPYLLLTPPSFGYVNSDAGTGGGGVGTKQFILPLGGDSTLSVLQISRVTALANATSGFVGTCTAAGSLPGNSPLCVGMVLYSLTFYRM